MHTTISLRPSPRSILRRAWHALTRHGRRLLGAMQWRRPAHAGFDALGTLDARALADLGLHRIELWSPAVGLAGSGRSEIQHTLDIHRIRETHCLIVRT
jgi:hypothetical protein